MERVLSSDERLRRAEEMYYRKRGEVIKETDKTVSTKASNTPVSARKYLLKKMVIQISICFIVYCSYYVIKTSNFIFSQELISKTKEILSYDINIQELYCKVANYINNYSYFNKNEEIPENMQDEKMQDEDLQSENTNEENSIEENTNESIGVNKEEALSVAEVNQEEINQEDSSLSQMQLDANEIKENYSLINPLVGQITSRFGSRIQTEEIVSPYHVGVDIAANTGTTIVASMDGCVVASSEIGGYGNCVQIQNNDILTIYGHCSKLCVNKGDVVVQGQKIAEVGQTRECNRSAFAF